MKLGSEILKQRQICLKKNPTTIRIVNIINNNVRRSDDKVLF